MKLLTAHSKAEFTALLAELPDLSRELKSSDKASDALFIYLMKLRTGRTYDEIALTFEVSAKTVERRCDLVRSILKRVIVPRYINFEMNRDEMVAHKSVTSRVLFDNNIGNENPLHLILDGTYIYLQKSTNHRFQKESYNSHKKRNYLKIMMGVCTDGWILFALGPFKATENDATITNQIFSSSTTSVKHLAPDDILIVDRGFRDCIPDLVNFNFIVKMPTCSDKNQLTTQEANQTRLVTKVRYDVERVNGLMKTVWKIFRETIDIHYIPKIMTDFEIGAALLNKRIKINDQDNAKQIAFARGMMDRVNMPNILSQIVNSDKFEKEVISQKKYERFVDFESCPQLQISDLEMISFGPYQIQQSRCYLSNHLHEENNELIINSIFRDCINVQCAALKLSKDVDPLLLVLNLKSRFASQRVHRVWAIIDKKAIGVRSVCGYCCSCFVGNRTVGCCSHVMALLYYIGIVRGDEIREVSARLKNLFEENNWQNNTAEEEEDEE